MSYYSRNVAGIADSKTGVAGAFDPYFPPRRRRRINPVVCERCLEFVDRVESALDDFYFGDDDHRHCCKCHCPRSTYWGRDVF